MRRASRPGSARVRAPGARAAVAAGGLAAGTLVLAAAAALLAGPVRADGSASGRVLREVRRLPSAFAGQAVAADARHLFVVDDRRIAKLDKASGAQLRVWEAPADGAIVHLNSGVVIDGRLHCAHSNYPGVPMESTIEIFDTATLAHLATRALPAGEGSATWVDRRDGRWWVTFAHYEGRGGEPGRGSDATRLVALDDAWQPVARYAFPAEVVRRFAGRSSSGGLWGADGRVWATGHDARELYVLRLPERGAELELVEIVAAPFAGQGIARDPRAPRRLWGIDRGAGVVIEARLEERAAGGAPGGAHDDAPDARAP